MQKVVGSSPIIRLSESPTAWGFLRSGSCRLKFRHAAGTARGYQTGLPEARNRSACPPPATRDSASRRPPRGPRRAAASEANRIRSALHRVREGEGVTAQYPAGSGVRASVLLREAGGFEGFIAEPTRLRPELVPSVEIVKVVRTLSNPAVLELEDQTRVNSEALAVSLRADVVDADHTVFICKQVLRLGAEGAPVSCPSRPK